MQTKTFITLKWIFESVIRPGHDDEVNEKDYGSDEGEDADSQDCAILRTRLLRILINRILIRMARILQIRLVRITRRLTRRVWIQVARVAQSCIACFMILLYPTPKFDVPTSQKCPTSPCLGRWRFQSRLAWTASPSPSPRWTVSYPSRWSLSFIFGFLWWSSILHHPGNREI